MKRPGMLWLSILVGLVWMVASASAEGITEEEIPAPTVVCDLPKGLIGTFVVPALYDNIELCVYASNKYIVRVDGDDHSAIGYGYLHEEAGAYYLTPLKARLIDQRTEIKLTSDGFAFVGSYGEQLVALRKVVTAIDALARTVSLPWRTAKRAYFSSDEGGSRVVTVQYSEAFPGEWFSLSIQAGAVVVALHFRDGAVAWKGFLHLSEQDGLSFVGQVRFTGGASYLYLGNQDAAIEAVGDAVTLRLRCGRRMESPLTVALAGWQPQATTLVVEF